MRRGTIVARNELIRSSKEMAVEKAPSTAAETMGVPPARRRLRLLFLLPAAAFIGLVVAFGVSLNRDPSIVPSALIGKPVPVFNLPPVPGHGPGLSSGDLRGAVSLVNVFASWCVACREEHPLLMALKERHVVPIYGIDYKDKPEDAARWLDTMGDPYARIGADRNGRVAINWGVYGVPETYVIDREGRIAFKQIGPINERVLSKTIIPLIMRLRSNSRSLAGPSETSGNP